jgi:hypothetical protein
LPGILSANDYTAPALPTATQNVSPRYPQPFAAIATVDLATPHPATQMAVEPLPWLRGEVNRLMVAAGEGQGKSAAPAPMQPLFTNLRAEVIGNEPGGGNFVQTAIGTLYIKTAQILPPGTTLTLTLAPQAPDTLPAPLAPLLPEAIDDFTILAREWTSLKNLFTALGTIDPSLAAALADRILPKPHAKLTNEMLFFLAAIKKGDVSEWLGRHARDVLADRAPETLDRLARDFLQLQQAITEPKTQGWTGLVIPFLTQGQLQQMRLYMKQDEASGGKRGDHLEHPRHDEGRQAERGLVEKEQPRPAHERPGDRQHLLLTAGKRTSVLRDPLLQPRKNRKRILDVIGNPGLVAA